MALRIHTYPNNPRVWKATVAGKYVGVEIEEVAVDMMKGEHKSAAFLALNPLGKVPTLETPEGGLWESNAIALYVANKGRDTGILGRTEYEQGLVLQWMEWGRSTLDTPLSIWIYPILGYLPNNVEAVKMAEEDLTNALKTLNNHLKLRTFLVGERITLADIVVASQIYWAFNMVFDKKFRKPIQNVVRWFLTVVNQPNFIACAGEFKGLIEERQVAAAPAADAGSSSSSAPAAEAKPAPAAEEKPKKKGKNPLDELPKSSFILDEWKKTYKNEKDTRGKACTWFFENFDPEGYSVYKGKYKYPEDNQVAFMVSNLLGGFFQRLEALRKYGMGVMLILKTDVGIGIEGVFVVRGNSIPPEMSDCPDFESYSFEPLDITSAEGKKYFEDVMAYDLPADQFGEYQDGKVFV